jgi:hypothetical protein
MKRTTLLIALALVACADIDPKEQESRNAQAACRAWVRERLKAPATAVFPLDAENVYRSGNSFTVQSFLDAENSFGALIRMRYTCIVEHTNDRLVLGGLDIRE